MWSGPARRTPLRLLLATAGMGFAAGLVHGTRAVWPRVAYEEVTMMGLSWDCGWEPGEVCVPVGIHELRKKAPWLPGPAVWGEVRRPLDPADWEELGRALRPAGD